VGVGEGGGAADERGASAEEGGLEAAGAGEDGAGVAGSAEGVTDGKGRDDDAAGGLRDGDGEGREEATKEEINVLAVPLLDMTATIARNTQRKSERARQKGNDETRR
jgi:hypothetical protein